VPFDDRTHVAAVESQQQFAAMIQAVGHNHQMLHPMFGQQGLAF